MNAAANLARTVSARWWADDWTLRLPVRAGWPCAARHVATIPPLAIVTQPRSLSYTAGTLFARESW